MKSLSVVLIGLITTFSQIVKADTKLDGYWQIDPSYGINCVNRSAVDGTGKNAFLTKYSNYDIHLSDLSATIYWVTPEHEAVTVSMRLQEIIPNKHYRTVPPAYTTIAPVDLVLLNGTQMEYRSKDYEWDLCQHGQYKVVYKWLRLNP